MVATEPRSVEDELSSLFERRLGGLMLVRLELTDLLEKFKREEHALATSLRGILQLRDQERTSFEARLSRSQAYAKKLEYELSSRGLPLPAAPTSPFVPEVRAASGFGAAAAVDSIENCRQRALTDRPVDLVKDRPCLMTGV